MSVVIKVEHVSKRYIIRHQQAGSYSSLRDAITEKTKQIFHTTENLIKNKERVLAKKEEFWALRDINLNIEQGDRLGIVGKNGAGKSTLLKILSRITEPTDGRISIKGRIASLLEVGTGFHPELSGRENIFLNGAILGMRRAEIKRRFDEIVEFSGVEKFLDTPVKRYSSGMYVRLAFAVAAHLDSEILIIDEVLAVGDSEFQKKCLGKMQDISKEGLKTVLFVSHNMQAVTNLCSTAILLDKGSIVQNGSPQKVVRDYLMFEASKSGSVFWDQSNALGDTNAQLMAIRLLDEQNNVTNKFFTKSKIRIEFDVNINKLDDDLVIGCDITDEDGLVIFRTYQNDGKQENWPELKTGRNKMYCEIPAEFLNAGTYYICPKISLHFKKWIVDGNPTLSFDVEINHGVSPFWNRISRSTRPGYLSIILPWTKQNLD